jgi:hypothetical protein
LRIVVPEVVVRRDGEGLDAGVHEELGKDGVSLISEIVSEGSVKNTVFTGF